MTSAIGHASSAGGEGNNFASTSACSVAGPQWPVYGDKTAVARKSPGQKSEVKLT
jgi:hypothetical protein